MYIPQQYQEERVEVLHDLIRRHGLATNTTNTDGAGLTFWYAYNVAGGSQRRNYPSGPLDVDLF